MIAQLKKPKSAEIIYPDSDGEPMADNTLQFRWISVIYHNINWLFAEQENVFVAGDLLWYPVEGNNKLRQAPDVMVAFGVKKGDRGSYMQWKEGGVAPQVVFEILSPGNRLTPMNRKQVFYNRYGVEEYYIYDPNQNDLSGWLRGEQDLEVIEEMSGWVSPRLKIRFDWSEERLQLYRPNGEAFIGYIEISRRLEQALEAVEAERQRAEQQQQRAERLAERLRALGVNPEANGDIK